MSAALFSMTQQRVLGLLFGQPERSFYQSELISLSGVGSGAVQRELVRLVDAGLVSAVTRDGRKVYSANKSSPIFAELASIIEKTGGVADQLRRALVPLSKKIDLAILFGSVAKESDNAKSDIDLLVVSDELMLEDLFRRLAPAERRLGRPINPTLYTTAELDTRRRSKNPFLTKVLAGKHQVLIGELHGHQGA